MRSGRFGRLASAKATRWTTAICAFVCAITPAFSFCVCSGQFRPFSTERCERCASETEPKAEASCCASKARGEAEPVKACRCHRAAPKKEAREKSPSPKRKSACCLRFGKNVFWNDARTIQVERQAFLVAPADFASSLDLVSRQATCGFRDGRELIRGAPPLFILLLVLRN